MNTEQSNPLQAENTALQNRGQQTLRRNTILNWSYLAQRMTTSRYGLMWMLVSNMKIEREQKVYVQDIAQTLKLPLKKVTDIVRKLQDDGLVLWKHDGDGADGTYIQITERGEQTAEAQQEMFETVQDDVIERFGKGRFMELLEELRELEDIIDSTMEKEVQEK